MDTLETSETLATETAIAPRPESPSLSPQPLSLGQRWGLTVALLAMIYLFIAAIDTLSLGFQLISGPQAEALFDLIQSPFSGLLVGIVATALIQSSSIVTTLLVTMAAAGLPLATAIPMIMGANVGTTITSTLVSLGFVGEDEGFQRSFAAATVHDFFNLLSVLCFFPLELTLHPLAKLTGWLVQQLPETRTLPFGNLPNPMLLVAPVRWGVTQLVNDLPGPWDALLLFSLSVGGLMVAIATISWLAQRLLVGRTETVLHWAIGKGSVLGIAAGAGITAVVQSSSLTTSLMVPLAGAGIVTLEEVYPFMLGANIGTCVTALLAAWAVVNVPYALQIALVHLCFNSISVLVIYSIPFLQALPLKAARWLSALATEYRALAIAYVLVVFFGIPVGLLWVFSYFNL